MGADVSQLPEGFVLDGGGAAPELPEGFQLDEQPAGEGDSWRTRRLNAAQSIALQAAKPMSGLIALAGEHIVGNLPGGQKAGEWMQQTPLRVSEASDAIQAQREAGNPKGFDFGDVEEFGTEALLTLPATGLRAGGMLTRAATGAGAAAALAPGNEGTAATAGGTVNALLPPAMRVAANVLSPQTRTQAGRLYAEGVRDMTPGMVFGQSAKAAEDKLASLPVVGDLIRGGQRQAIQSYNNVELNRALAPINARVQGAGREAIAEAQDIVDGAYRELLPRLSVRFDDEFIGNVSNLRNMAQGLPPEQAAIFNRALERDVLGRFTEHGTGSGQSAQEALSVISRRIKDAYRAGDVDSRALGGALRELQAQLRNAIDRSNPQLAGELQRVNQARAMLAQIEDAAERAGSKEGIFSPTAKMASVRKGARRSGSQRRVSGGRALGQNLAETAESVMGQRVPDSGTAGRVFMGGAAALAPGAAAAPVSLPAAAGLAGLVSPYLPGGRQLFNYLAFARPPGANALAGGVARAAPLVAPVTLPASNALIYGGN